MDRYTKTTAIFTGSHEALPTGTLVEVVGTVSNAWWQFHKIRTPEGRILHVDLFDLEAFYTEPTSEPTGVWVTNG